MLAHLELSPRRRLCSFSTGEMIKYQFAFAAAYRPKVLLMDEPTANLDPVFRDDFLKLLQEFVAEYEMTILLATHLDEDLSGPITPVTDGSSFSRFASVIVVARSPEPSAFMIRCIGAPSRVYQCELFTMFLVRIAISKPFHWR